MQHPDDPDLCACGLSTDEVSMAHFISCGEDALADSETAERVVDSVVAAIERKPLYGRHLLTTPLLSDPHATGRIFDDDYDD